MALSGAARIFLELVKNIQGTGRLDLAIEPYPYHIHPSHHSTLRMGGEDGHPSAECLEDCKRFLSY